MRRHFLLFCLLLPCLATAQVGSYRADLAVGVSGGYALNQISFNPTIKQSWKGGATLGLTVRYTCEKYLSAICALQGEVNYIDLGWKELIEPQYGTDTYYRQVHYVQVPVLARLGWGRERKGLQFFVQAGPQLGWYLSDKTKMNFDWDQRTPSYSNGTGRMSPIVAQDTMAIKNKLDYGIAAGGGFEVSINHVGHFLVEGRYYFGLGNIFANSKRDYFSRSNFNNITIKMSYLFDIARTKNSKIK